MQSLNQKVILPFKYHYTSIILLDLAENKNHLNLNSNFIVCSGINLCQVKSTPVGSIIPPADCSITVLQEQDTQGSVFVPYSYTAKSLIHLINCRLFLLFHYSYVHIIVIQT